MRLTRGNYAKSRALEISSSSSSQSSSEPEESERYHKLSVSCSNFTKITIYCSRSDDDNASQNADDSDSSDDAVVSSISFPADPLEAVRSMWQTNVIFL